MSSNDRGSATNDKIAIMHLIFLWIRLVLFNDQPGTFLISSLSIGLFLGQSRLSSLVPFCDQLGTKFKRNSTQVASNSSESTLNLLNEIYKIDYYFINQNGTHKYIVIC